MSRQLTVQWPDRTEALHPNEIQRAASITRPRIGRTRKSGLGRRRRAYRDTAQATMRPGRSRNQQNGSEQEVARVVVPCEAQDAVLDGELELEPAARRRVAADNRDPRHVDQ
jgi:hypothetical protein